ncbi:MAG: hypothetical protein GXP09_10805 [Gammaproteobacteria bacterium]|nr:hypothetical protein [Gammaproteobacteria bacterium]
MPQTLTQTLIFFYRLDCIIVLIMTISYYKSLREDYKPKPLELKAVFIAESPPSSGRYFYDPEGSPTGEVLFRELLIESLGLRFGLKKEGLEAFRDKGFLLVDGTYQRINKNKNGNDIPSKQRDVIPLILIKTTVLNALAKPLHRNGFNIVNYNKAKNSYDPVFFPGRKTKYFRAQLRPMLESIGMAPPIELVEKARIPLSKRRTAKTGGDKIDW